MRGLLWIQVICAVGAILFARSVGADDWPYYQHDAWHTGDSSAFVSPQALPLTWTAPSSPTGYSTPVIVGNNIYAMQNQWRGLDIVWIQQIICSYSRLPFLPKSPTSVLHQPTQFRRRGSSRELAQPLRRLSGLATQVRRDRPQRIAIQPPHSGNIDVHKYYMRAYSS